MTLQEYKTYYDQCILNQIEQYLNTKYTKNMEYIFCRFDVYSFDIKRNKVSMTDEKMIPKRADYAFLLSVLLKHPEVTFAELPRFIPERLYVDMLCFLRFPTTCHPCSPDCPRRRSMPMAVEMITLQEDAQAIAKDVPYHFVLHSNTPNAEYGSISVSI